MAHEVIMPALGMAQDTGKLVNWLLSEGDQVKTGDILFEVETDKSTMEVESQADGYLHGISADAGDDVPVGQVIALISDTPGTGERILPATKEAEPATTEPEKPTKSPPAEALALRSEDVPAAPVAPTNKILASPKAKRLASEMGLDLADLAAAGHPQPYHVADIERLKSLQPHSQAASCFLAFEVDKCGVRDFLEWIQSQGGIVLDLKHVWISFATASLRHAKGIDGEAVITEFTTLDGHSSTYLNADRQRLSSLDDTEDAATPDIIVRDITTSSFTQVRLGASKAPTLTIAQTESRYMLTLEFSSQQLDDEQAIALANDFCARMTNPLQHVI